MEKKEIIIFGGSAGSIDVLMRILPFIPKDFPLPIVVVVHRKLTVENLLEGLFQSRCDINIVEVEDKMPMKAGFVYLAPAGYHLLIEKDHTFSLDYSEKVNYSRPNIDVAMQSIVDVFHEKVIGILLTGANDDGAKGMKYIKDAGGLTITQSAESSSMHTMPEAAENIMKPDQILSPEEILKFIISISENKCECCH